MVGCFMFQWGWVVFQMGGFILRGGDVPWRVSVLMGWVSKKLVGSLCPSPPTMRNADNGGSK